MTNEHQPDQGPQRPAITFEPVKATEETATMCQERRESLKGLYMDPISTGDHYYFWTPLQSELAHLAPSKRREMKDMFQRLQNEKSINQLVQDAAASDDREMMRRLARFSDMIEQSQVNAGGGKSFNKLNKTQQSYIRLAAMVRYAAVAERLRKTQGSKDETVARRLHLAMQDLGQARKNLMASDDIPQEFKDIFSTSTEIALQPELSAAPRIQEPPFALDQVFTVTTADENMAIPEGDVGELASENESAESTSEFPEFNFKAYPMLASPARTDRAKWISSELENLYDGSGAIPSPLRDFLKQEENGNKLAWFDAAYTEQEDNSVNNLIPYRYLIETKESRLMREEISDLADELTGEAYNSRSLSKLIEVVQGAAKDNNDLPARAMRLLGRRLLQKFHPGQTMKRDGAKITMAQRASFRLGQCLIAEAQMALLAMYDHMLDKDNTKKLADNFREKAIIADLPMKLQSRLNNIASKIDPLAEEDDSLSSELVAESDTELSSEVSQLTIQPIVAEKTRGQRRPGLFGRIWRSLVGGPTDTGTAA